LEILRPICTAWKEKINAAIKHRQGWYDVAEQCEMFYAAACGFMWDDKYRTKLKLPKYAPKFQMTIAKAFEFVAIFGPSLYWRNPIRTFKSRQQITLAPDMLPFLPPEVQAQAAIVHQRGVQEQYAVELTRQLVSGWLNYTPGENAGGGLKMHSMLAITDALVKGRGCLEVRPYSYPGSERLLTGSFYVHPYDVVIDPDANSTWDAKWIAVRYTQPTWEVERMFGVEPGTFKDYSRTSTYGGQAENGTVYNAKGERVVGSTFDSMTYWRIYSKGGVGVRLKDTDKQIPQLQTLDQIVGDFACICVAECDDSKEPLNMPSAVLMSAPEEEIKRRFAWPIPYYKDGKWPVAFLDFYPRPGSTWPIAPLQPGLGELMFMNVMMSHACNRMVTSLRDFVQAPEALRDKVQTVMDELNDLGVFGVTQEFAGQDVIKFIQHPPMNMDYWRIMDAVADAFDKRVGLSDLMYGNNPGAASRTAEDAAIKRQSLSVRPDYFASQVEDWQSQIASMENLCTQVFIRPQDVAPVLGEVGAMLWQSLVMSRPIEDVLRDTQMTIEAGTARKPNKDRDVANITQAMQMFLPFLQQYTMASGNPGPLNAMIRQWGEANDFDPSEMFIPPPPPPPPMPAPGPGQPGAEQPPQDPSAPPVEGPLGMLA
jgi:hypothetical protein